MTKLLIDSLVKSLIFSLALCAIPIFNANAEGAETDSPSAGKVANDRAAAEYSAGLKDYKARQYNSAAGHFWNSIKEGNGSASAWLYLGHSYVGSGKRERAIDIYGRIQKLFKGTAAEQTASLALRRIQSTPNKKSSKSVIDISSKKQGSASHSISRSDLSRLPERARVFYRTSGSDDILLNVKINGRPIEMEFDTGAPDICIAKNQLSSLGIKTPTRNPDGKSGGASNSIKIPYWEIPADVQVGPIRREKLNITVFESMHSKPLLGQEFFRDFDYTIDHHAKCLELRRKGTSTSFTTGTGYSVPFKFRKSGSRIVVEVEINGRKGPVMFDTGNTASGISFDSEKQMERYGLKLPANKEMSTTIGVSGRGKKWKFYLDRVKLGPIDKRRVLARCAVEIDADDEELPLLGADMLSGWQYSIDMNKKVINFLRR